MTGTNIAHLGGVCSPACGSCHCGLDQGCRFYWHPSSGAVLLCFPRQVWHCLTRFWGWVDLSSPPFLAWDLTFCPCLLGRHCPGAAPRMGEAHGGLLCGLPAGLAWGWGLELGHPVPIFALCLPLQVPASSCPAPLELRISGLGSSTCGITPSSPTCRRERKMGSRYPALPGRRAHKAGLGLELVALGDALSQQTTGWGEGRRRDLGCR